VLRGSFDVVIYFILTSSKKKTLKIDVLLLENFSIYEIVDSFFKNFSVRVYNLTPRYLIIRIILFKKYLFALTTKDALKKKLI